MYIAYNPQSHMASLLSLANSFFKITTHIKDQEIPCGILAGSFASAGMETIDDSFEPSTCSSSSCCSKHHEKMEEEEEEPVHLLDNSWFFGNLLDRKTRMSRCYSDPCPSSNLTDEEMLVGKSYEETFSSLKTLPQEGKDKFTSGLIRAPSLPEGSTLQAKGSNSNNVHRGSKSALERSSNSLFRAPSLPISLGREEIQDEESDFSMSKLIRQASLKHSDMLPPRGVPKGLTQSSSTPRQRPRRKPGTESIKTESPEGRMIRRQHSLSQTKLYKSSSDLAEGLQSFNDLSIKFDSPELGSGIQEKKQQQQFSLNEDKLRKSHLSDQTWLPDNSSSQMGKRSVEDMKAQIKFWARAVASNVRQEC